jgi:hypothetical protein
MRAARGFTVTDSTEPEGRSREDAGKMLSANVGFDRKGG